MGKANFAEQKLFLCYGITYLNEPISPPKTFWARDCMRFGADEAKILIGSNIFIENARTRVEWNGTKNVVSWDGTFSFHAES
jgi:hypothetical protein